MRPSGLLSLVIFIIDFASGNRQYRFDYTYNVLVGGWLKLHVMPANFQYAFLMCNAEGSILASPLNENLRSAMLKLFIETSTESVALYTGIHATISKGSFTSVEGVPLSKIPKEWAPSEPDNYNNSEDCIVMLRNGTLADVQCTETFPYICYKKKTKDLVLNECGTIDNGYTLDTRTGSCYKFHQIGRNWRRAYMTCMAEGGHLAIINSDDEAQVLKDIFDKYPSSSIKAQNNNVASIGIYASPDHSLWFTIHGDTLDQAGYATFSVSEPNNDRSYDGGSYCGAMFKSGLMDDIWCDSVTFPFICEKQPGSLLSDAAV